MLDTTIPCQRFLFDIPDDIAYFNCAYMAPSLKSVRAAGELGVGLKSKPWVVGAEDFFKDSKKLRGLVAELIGCESQEIAIIPSVSYGIATAAANLALPREKHCIVLEEQFPSNYYAWEKTCDVRTVTRPSDGNWTQAVLDSIDSATGVVALPHCHWTDGSMLDLNRIGETCQQRHIPLVLDVTQSLGALPLDLQQVKPAFMVAAAYKWLLGPYSLAFMYVDPAHHNGTPLEQNWIARKDSENFGNLVQYTSHYEPGAIRFDVGERSNFTLLPMSIAAIHQILSWGIDFIQNSLSLMTMEMAEQAKSLGFQVEKASQRCGHMLGIRAPQGLPDDLLKTLNEQNIFVSIRGDAIRISPHLYNHEGDSHRLFNVLKWVFKNESR